MAQEPTDTDIRMDADHLYQEETFTDRRIGTLVRLTPVTAAGVRDESRPVLYVGQTQVLTPACALPLSLEIDASSRGEAVQEFGAQGQDALAPTVKPFER